MDKKKLKKLGENMRINLEYGFKLNRVWLEGDTYHFQYFNMDNLFKIGKSTLEVIKVHEDELVGKYEFYVEQIEVPRDFKITLE